MNKIIFSIIFIAFTTTALAETAQLGENQAPPKKTTAGGCAYARAKKNIALSSTATKTETRKSKTMEIGN